jgi:hypothetical protein
MSYQLDLRTPGIRPWEAYFLKHSLHMQKSLMKALRLPQSSHRLYCLTLNFFTFFHFAIHDFLAIISSGSIYLYL